MTTKFFKNTFIKLLMTNSNLVLILLLLFSSCSSSLYTGNGAVHNANFTTDQYKIKDLDISESGISYFGIPINQKASPNSGFTFNFNGITISKVPAFVPALTLFAFSFQSAQIMAELGIGESSGYGHTSPNGLSYVLGLPVAATINTLLWRGASKGAAGSEINTNMLVDNPEVDMFLFPKYTTQTDGFYKETSTVNLRVKAATLKY